VKYLPETHRRILKLSDTGKVNEVFEKNRKKVTWNSFDNLFRKDIINGLEATVVDIKYTIYGGKGVARIQMAKRPNDGVAYIRWVRVSEDFQSEGLGGLMYSEICEKLISECNSVLIKPVSSGMKNIARNNNFKPDDRLSDPWHKKQS
jgi:hypothetical protein